ncbi:MAG: hypothetical protein ACXWB9_00230 [Flavisolibacter sp.]
MKNLLLLVFVFTAIGVSAQKISGFYSGTLYNDSTKMTQKYELAVNEYRGKITGYSYVTFIAKDTFYWGIRRVKATIIGDSLVVEDDKIVANNFPEPPAKKVGRIITIPLKGQDSIVSLDGTWKTNQTKIYYSVPGSIKLDRSSDSASSPLISHLRELKIIQDPVYAKEEVKEKKETRVKVKKEAPKVETLPVIVEEVKPVSTQPVLLAYHQRTNKLLQTIEVQSDSLVLAFYDNGVVDGDSVSVYLNNQNIISAIRLKTVATKKTIQVATSGDLEILLVAENLGSIPPNTGLMTITDGEKVYQVHFSADMKTNASIIIRRKREQM